VLGIAGLPLPDETILTAAGYLVYRGHMSYVPTLVAGVAGAAGGISLSYCFGRFLGRPAILRLGRVLHVTDRGLARAEAFFERYGGAALVGGLFIPGIRHLVALVAGFCGMRFPRFIGPAFTGACLWVTAFVTLGRFAGPHIVLHVEQIPRALLWAMGMIIVAAAAVWAGTRNRPLRAGMRGGRFHQSMGGWRFISFIKRKNR
jgi:membrane protein DedA with SNARE-associated domain